MREHPLALLEQPLERMRTLRDRGDGVEAGSTGARDTVRAGRGRRASPGLGGGRLQCRSRGGRLAGRRLGSCGRLLGGGGGSASRPTTASTHLLRNLLLGSVRWRRVGRDALRGQVIHRLAYEAEGGRRADGDERRGLLLPALALVEIDLVAGVAHGHLVIQPRRREAYERPAGTDGAGRVQPTQCGRASVGRRRRSRRVLAVVLGPGLILVHELRERLELRRVAELERLERKVFLLPPVHRVAEAVEAPTKPVTISSADGFK